jgi:hypothetical protein
MMTTVVKSKTRTKNVRRACQLRDLSGQLAESSVRLEEALQSYLSHPNQHVVEVTLDETLLGTTMSTAVSVPALASSSTSSVVKAETSKVSSELNWICCSCAVKNFYSGEGDKLCSGCEKVFKEGDDEDILGTLNAKTIKQFLIGVEQSVAQREANVPDLDVFFPEDEYSVYADTPLLDSAASKVDRKNARLALLSSEVEMEAMGRDLIINPVPETKWQAVIEESYSARLVSGSRRRRRNVCTIPIATFVNPRTPRSVPLFVSPLSLQPDKVG